MTSTTHPTAIWTVIAPPRARDGDSIYLLRERELSRDVEEILIRRDPKPVLTRCAWLACPEISGPNRDPVNGPRATNDAQYWLDAHFFVHGTLIAVQYGLEKYGRPLVDIRTADGDSLSQWMLAKGNDGKGWPAYRG